MALETASYIANLVASNPDGGDQRSTADDHLRLVKAVLLRTFPKLDAAVSLSATQVMYLNDLSASVQLQLNQLRDGSATANNAINSRYADSASVAAFIGAIPANDVVRLSVTASFSTAIYAGGTVHGGFGLRATGYNPAGWAGPSVELGWTGALGFLSVYNRTNATYGSLRIEAANVVVTGPITGTISNATNAVTATNAANASNANNAITAATATNASSAATLNGLSPSDSGGANTVATRNSSGDIFARYLNTSQGDSENPAVAQLVVRNGTDNYYRMADVAHAGQYIAGQNISGRAGTAKTLSSSAPSGGSNGDIWYQY